MDEPAEVWHLLVDIAVQTFGVFLIGAPLVFLVGWAAHQFAWTHITYLSLFTTYFAWAMLLAAWDNRPRRRA